MDMVSSSESAGCTSPVPTVSASELSSVALLRSKSMR